MSNCSTCQAFELQIKEIGMWIRVLTVQRDRARELGAPSEALDSTLSAEEQLRSELRNAYSAHLSRHKSDAIPLSPSKLTSEGGFPSWIRQPSQ